MIGAGWWSQGWHIPHLYRHPDVNLVAIVDSSAHPTSNLNPNLEPLSILASRYQTKTYSSVSEMLTDPSVGPTLDGAIVATPHATHYSVGEELLRVAQQRRQRGERPIHILMEKPMTTNVHSAKKLHDLVQEFNSPPITDATSAASPMPALYFMINHSANYRAQTRMARQLVDSGAIGEVRHVTAFLASALSWIFEDPTNSGWNVPTDGMIGNGFAWGQSSHILAWMYHVCPQLQPRSVYCDMIHSDVTGADVAHAASIRCVVPGTDGDNHNTPTNNKEVVVSLSGTSLLPGNEHSHPPVGKQIRLKIFGTKGTIIYSGVSEDVASGRLELRRMETGGVVEYPMGDGVGFEFESLDAQGTGPESVQSFVQACLLNRRDDTDDGSQATMCYVGADSLVGFRTVQTLDAMYRSHQQKQPVPVLYQI